MDPNIQNPQQVYVPNTQAELYNPPAQPKRNNKILIIFCGLLIILIAGLSRGILVISKTKHTPITPTPVITTAISPSEIHSDASVYELPSDTRNKQTLLYYVDVSGSKDITITDSKGNSNTPFDERQEIQIIPPDVTRYILGDNSVEFILPSTQIFTITYTQEEQPSEVEITYGTNDEHVLALRYLDVNIPVGTKVRFATTPKGVSLLSYDKDNNGSFETKVEPSAIAKGNDAQDTEPPKLTVMSKKVATQTEVTITATDNLSGVKKIYYSTDGAQFNEYTAQFTVGSSLKKISAFADDNLANRSSLLEYPLK